MRAEIAIAAPQLIPTRLVKEGANQRVGACWQHTGHVRPEALPDAGILILCRPGRGGQEKWAQDRCREKDVLIALQIDDPATTGKLNLALVGDITVVTPAKVGSSFSFGIYEELQ